MSALILFGYSPGPELFEQNLDVAGGTFLAYLFAYLALLLLGFLLTPIFLSVLRLRKVHLLPLVVMLSVMGAFALQSSVFDLWSVLGFGALGYFLRLYGYPLSPIVIGVMLGPICESNFRRSLLISRDGLSIFWEREIAFTILSVTVILVVWGLAGKGVSKWLKRQFSRVR